MAEDEKDLEAKIREQKRVERRNARIAANAFARACEKGDAAELLGLASQLYAWGAERPAMIKVARLPRVSQEVRDAFLGIWIESKHLTRRVGDRRVLANALHVLLSCDYSGPPLTLYRGAKSSERRCRLYGFSWTSDIDVARQFAEHWAEPRFASEGVILQAVAPPEAIMLVRKPEDYQQLKLTDKGTWEPAYDEGEVVVDPFRLGKIKVVERLTKKTAEGLADAGGAGE